MKKPVSQSRNINPFFSLERKMIIMFAAAIEDNCFANDWNDC